MSGRLGCHSSLEYAHARTGRKLLLVLVFLTQQVPFSLLQLFFRCDAAFVLGLAASVRALGAQSLQLQRSPPRASGTAGAA